MVTYKILIYLQQIFDSHGVPAAAGSVEKAKHEMMHYRLHIMLLCLLMSNLMDAFINTAVMFKIL